MGRNPPLLLTAKKAGRKSVFITGGCGTIGFDPSPSYSWYDLETRPSACVVVVSENVVYLHKSSWLIMIDNHDFDHSLKDMGLTEK